LVLFQEDFMALSLEHLDGVLYEILDATFREHPYSIG
jgi:hypothetical protein